MRPKGHRPCSDKRSATAPITLWWGRSPADYEPPPLHFHPHTDEAFYVAEGELTVVLSDREIVAPAGTLVFIPRGVVHTARNSGSRSMRGAILISPGDAEHLFEPPENA